MDSNLVALAFARETTWGVLAAPALKLLRMTKESFEHAKETETSSEIRPDRQRGESAEVGVSAKGGFDFELTVGDFDLFLESALMSAFAAVGGVATLLNGVTRTSYLVEKKFAAAGSYLSFPGMMLDTLTLQLQSKKIITGTAGFMGQQGVFSAATVDANASYTAAGTGELLTSTAHVANIRRAAGGAVIAGCKNLTLTVNNNLRGNDEIGLKRIGDVGLGEVAVSGKLDAYFRDATLLQEFINHTASSLSFEVSREPAGAVSGDHIGYRFTVPRLRWTKGVPMTPGKNADVMLPLEFEAEAGTFGGTPATIAIEKLTKA